MGNNKFKNVTITININHNKEQGNLGSQIYVNGDWKKEIAGGDLYLVGDIFDALSKNSDFKELIYNEINYSNAINGDFFKHEINQKEKEFLLYELFGFKYIDGVLYDNYDTEFYADEENHNTDFDTLEHIFTYHKYISELKGRNSFRRDYEKLMKNDII